MNSRDQLIFKLKSDIQDARQNGRWEIAIKLQSKLKKVLSRKKKKNVE